MRTAIGLSMMLIALGAFACAPGSDDGDVQPYVEEQETYLRTANQQLAELEQDMNDLKTRLQAPGEESQTEVQQEVASWERNYEELERKIADARVESAEEWDEFQSEIDEALADLRRSVDEMSRRVRASVR